MHSLLRAACPHRLEAFQVRILRAFAAAGSLPAPQPAPSSSLPIGNLACIRCYTGSLPAPRSSLPIGNVGCFRCCGQPAQSLLRALCPHRLEAFQLGILGSFAAACPRCLEAFELGILGRTGVWGAFAAAGSLPALP